MHTRLSAALKSDLFVAIAASMLAALVVPWLFFAVNGAPLFVMLIFALPGYAVGLLLRSDRVLRCLPPLIAAAALFGTLASLLAFGPPNYYDAVTRTWHIDFVRLFSDAEARTLWASVGFVFLMGSLLGTVARGLARFRRDAAWAILLALPVAAIVLSAAFSRHELRLMRIEQVVRQAAYCQQDSDCVNIGPWREVGLGCYVSVNKLEAERMRQYLAPFSGHASPYCSGNHKPQITCRQNRCGAWAD